MFPQCRDKVLLFGDEGSGITVVGFPLAMMKCLGVRAKGSLMTVDGAVRGRDFSMGQRSYEGTG